MDLNDEETKANTSTDDDDSEGWEEVPPLDKPEGQSDFSAIPAEGLIITVPKDGYVKPKDRKKLTFEAIFRREANRYTREVQENLHKVHLLCLMSTGMMYNNILRSQNVLAAGLSTLPSKQAYPPKNLDLVYLEKFIKWFRQNFSVSIDDRESNGLMATSSLEEELLSQFQHRKALSHNYLVCLFIVILRSLDVQARLIWSLSPVPLKPNTNDILKDPDSKTLKKQFATSSIKVQEATGSGDSHDNKIKTNGIKNCQKTTRHKNKKPDKKEGKLETQPSSSSSNNKISNAEKSTAVKKGPRKRPPCVDSDESDYDPSPVKRKKQTVNSKSKKIIQQRTKAGPVETIKTHTCNICNIRISTERYHCSVCENGDYDMCKNCYQKLSHQHKLKVILCGPSDNNLVEKNGKEKKALFYDFWTEVFLEEEERWISVDLTTGSVLCDSVLESKARQPVTYILGFGNKGNVKDITRRYAPHWLTATQKLRVDSVWCEESLRPFREIRTKRDKEEDEFLDRCLLNQPIPKSIQELKGHPLYAMKRHLLKFEGIYPPEPAPVGFLRNEPVFSRENVKTLHTKEVWLRQAKSVRTGEEPYKIVKSRPKYDKRSGQTIKDLPAELFGEWQVEDFIPPLAVGGKVPRNDFGNVELFQERMIPKGTVHIQVSGLNRIARKLDIDCARAVVGFEYHSGGCHPQFDGFVVCEEFKDILLDAWEQEQKEMKRKENEKRKQKVYSNWARLVRTALIRERLIRAGHTFGTADKLVEKKKKSNAKSKR